MFSTCLNIEWRQSHKSTCRLETKISRIETKIKEMDITKTNREELKTVALGTSKINYLDPRITVAWCKTHEVPIEKVLQSLGSPLTCIIALSIAAP